MKIDINGVSITLTPEQLAEIARQTNQVKSYKDITSFEKACERLGLEIPQFSSELTKGEIALRKLKIIVRAIRSFTNWKPVWSNTKQWKYTVWFDLEKGFSYWTTFNCSTNSTVPSALFVESNEQAEFLGKTHLDLYKDYIFDGE
jgi:hypothetical protein